MAEGEIGSSISGAVQLIQSIAPLAADATSVTFSNLDINADKKYILEVFVNNQVLNTQFQLFVNNDLVTTNYRSTELNADFGVSAVTSGNNANAIFMSAVGDRLYGEIRIGLGDDNLMRCHSQFDRDIFFPDVGVWLSSITHTVATVNITRLDIVADHANGIGAGSFFRLYRVHP